MSLVLALGEKIDYSCGTESVFLFELLFLVLMLIYSEAALLQKLCFKIA